MQHSRCQLFCLTYPVVISFTTQLQSLSCTPPCGNSHANNSTVASDSDVVEVQCNFGIPYLLWTIDQLSIATKDNLTLDLKSWTMFNTMSNIIGYRMMICTHINLKPFHRNEIIHHQSKGR